MTRCRVPPRSAREVLEDGLFDLGLEYDGFSSVYEVVPGGGRRLLMFVFWSHSHGGGKSVDVARTIEEARRRLG